MNGSEKQIKWAEDIKGKMLAEMAEVEAFAQSETGKALIVRTWGEIEPAEREIRAALATIEQCRERINAQTEASWFIDNRDRMPVAAVRGDREVYQCVRSEMDMARRAGVYND